MLRSLFAVALCRVAAALAPLGALEAALNATVPALLAENGVDGASVGIVYEGQTALLRAWGNASITTGERFTADTATQQGSTSKTLAATAVLAVLT